jgi:alpha-tubulin suppressor-like RCC1 family protein
MPRFRIPCRPAVIAGLALAIACAEDTPTAPREGAQLAKASDGLKVTPARLSFTALGATGTLTAKTSSSGALTATVSTPACASVSPRRVPRSPAKFTVTATSPGSCSVTINDGIRSVVVPVVVAPLLRGTLVTGGAHTCGLTTAGAAYCWGTNRFGQLGSSTNTGADAPNPTPQPVHGNLVFTRLAAGSNHTCGLTAAGVAYCWGANDVGQLGTTTNLETGTPNPTPAAVATTDAFVDLKAGQWFTCGLKADGSVLCWGSNQWGQLGTETNLGGVSPNPTPNLIPGGVAFTVLSAGETHVCALTAAGAAYCWGRNNFGQLGTDESQGSGTGVTTPQAVGGNLSFTALATGGNHSCGITAAGVAWCWGRNERGELGTSQGQDEPFGLRDPVQVEGGVVFTALTAGEEHTCGLTASGAAYCWGKNDWGQLGRVTDFMQPTSTAGPVDGGLAFVQVSARADQTCGVTGAGAAYCWGSNFLGQLGTTTNSGTGNPTAAPSAVSGGLVFGLP